MQTIPLPQNDKNGHKRLASGYERGKPTNRLPAMNANQFHPHQKG
jgi:hypothetical protein